MAKPETADGQVFRLLVVGDIHYSPTDDPRHPSRRCSLGRELLRRAIEDARLRGGFDALAMLGDSTDSHDPNRQEPALADLVEDLRRSVPQTPLLVVPGNHDVAAEKLFAALGDRAGVHELRSAEARGGAAYRFVTFADPYGPGDACTRRQADRALLLQQANLSGAPIVVLQHNPMNPVIQDAYPYMLTNRTEVMEDYAKAAVVLSISGHHHPGQAPSVVGGVTYFTVPALCEAPFRYAVVQLRGRQVGIDVRGLTLPQTPRVADCHAHTQFAYCGRDLSAAGVIERARLFGLSGVCLVEHAPQLYCTADDFWNARHIRNGELWRRAEHSRMADFRREVEPLRDDYVRVGLEVELDSAGQITLHDGDRDWPDLLVGAVHWLPEDHAGMNDATLAGAFLRANERLLAGGLDVLAHPWRFFLRVKRPVPAHLYGRLADMLARTGTAAEVNFHTNQPEAAFFTECIQRGVKVCFGSDAHELYEVGALLPHLDLLREAAGGKDPQQVLFDPSGKGRTRRGSTA